MAKTNVTTTPTTPTAPKRLPPLILLLEVGVVPDEGDVPDEGGTPDEVGIPEGTVVPEGAPLTVVGEVVPEGVTLVGDIVGEDIPEGTELVVGLEEGTDRVEVEALMPPLEFGSLKELEMMPDESRTLRFLFTPSVEMVITMHFEFVGQFGASVQFMLWTTGRY